MGHTVDDSSLHSSRGIAATLKLRGLQMRSRIGLMDLLHGGYVIQLAFEYAFWPLEFER